MVYYLEQPKPGFLRAGEYKEQVSGFSELTVVLGISVMLIYIALVVQFKSAIKPALVFAAIPYGMTGAIARVPAGGGRAAGESARSLSDFLKQKVRAGFDVARAGSRCHPLIDAVHLARCLSRS